ncbi:hypothetical protein, partial [Clostridium luticellarii]|uniref:hypothetical protein n=1 Tax=Clostridium luticellarii TaxID=1691940 RepID=UPI001A9A44A2
MFQTVDEKYLIPKKNDYKKLIKYLQDYYTNNIKINESFIRIIHDNSWMFITWIKELNKTNLNNKFLNEIFVNIIATIHNIVHCDIKVANFLLRNSIENFLRFFNIFTV